MIILKDGIMLEGKEKRNMPIAGDEFMVPLSRVDRIATIADRIAYDASSRIAVDTLFRSGLYKRMCYPCIVPRYKGYYSLMDYMLDSMKYYEDYIEDNIDIEPAYMLLTTLVNRYILLFRKPVSSGWIQTDTMIIDNYSMDEYVLGVTAGRHLPSGEVCKVSSKKFIGKVFSIREIAELSDRLWKIQCVITDVSERRIASDSGGIWIDGVHTKDKFKDIEKIALKTLKGRPAVMV